MKVLTVVLDIAVINTEGYILVENTMARTGMLWNELLQCSNNETIGAASIAILRDCACIHSNIPNTDGAFIFQACSIVRQKFQLNMTLLDGLLVEKEISTCRDSKK